MGDESGRGRKYHHVMTKDEEWAPPPSSWDARKNAQEQAVDRRGGLAEDELLLAVPSGYRGPDESWKREDTVTSHGQSFDIYTARRDSLPIVEDEDTAPGPPTPSTPPSPSAPPGSDKGSPADVAGPQKMGKSIGEFSNSPPDEVCVKCLVREFGIGFMESFLPAFVVGFLVVAGLILAGITLPAWAIGAGIVVGLAVVAGQVRNLSRDWDQLTPEQRARRIGNIGGGVAGGAAGGGVAGAAGAGAGGAGGGQLALAGGGTTGGGVAAATAAESTGAAAGGAGGALMNSGGGGGSPGSGGTPGGDEPPGSGETPGRGGGDEEGAGEEEDVGQRRGEKGRSFRGGKKSTRDNWYGHNDKNFQALVASGWEGRVRRARHRQPATSGSGLPGLGFPRQTQGQIA